MSVNILNKTTRELEPIAGNSGGSSNASPDFVGTESEWNNLSATQKAQYDKSKGVTVNFTDDDLPDDIIGDTDISAIADGTLTGIAADHDERLTDAETDIATLNSALNQIPIQVSKKWIVENNGTVNLPLSRSNHYIIEVQSVNNASVYNYYRLGVYYYTATSTWLLATLQSVASSSTHFNLTFAMSGDSLVITNTGDYANDIAVIITTY